jgi:hypothetical protein
VSPHQGFKGLLVAFSRELFQKLRVGRLLCLSQPVQAAEGGSQLSRAHRYVSGGVHHLTYRVLGVGLILNEGIKMKEEGQGRVFR